jgi:hypothetical protein
MENNSSIFFQNRKRKVDEQFNYWRYNLGSGFLRFVERLVFKFNVSDLLAGNIDQTQHLEDVRDQIIVKRFLRGATMQKASTFKLLENNQEASTPQYLFVIRKARVDTLTGIVVLDSGFIIDSTIAKWQKIIYRGGIASAVRRAKNARKHITGAHIVLPHSPYYYHVLLDEMPNLLRIREAEPRFNKVLVHELMPKWAIELLLHFKFEITLTRDVSLIVEELAIISAPRCLLADDLLLLRTHQMQQGARVIIVSRSDTPRSDKNIEDLLLREIWGSEMIDPGNYTVLEQIQIFSSAKVIIGLHGGGLSNAVWMHQQGKVIELFNHPYRTSDYARICSELEINYIGLDVVGTDPEVIIDLVRLNLNA